MRISDWSSDVCSSDLPRARIWDNARYAKSSGIPALMKLRIATRESPLAMWQAEHVKARLEAAHPQLIVELLPMTTRGDQLLSSPLSTVGGQGLFVKELEQALLESRADHAEHSMKEN